MTLCSSYVLLLIMSLIKDFENLQALSVGEHSLEEVAALSGLVEKCPECGTVLRVRNTQISENDFEVVAWCAGCGYTETE